MKSRKPTATTIPLGVSVQRESLLETEWRSAFLNYYREARQYDVQALEDALFTMDGLGLGDSTKAQMFERAREALKLTHTSGKGTLGEAHFSYYLEQRVNTILTTAEWKRHPFDITQGIDLVGVRLPEMLVCHVEVKTYADVAAGFRDAVDQLRIDTMIEHFLEIPNSGHHTTIAVTLLKLIREGMLPTTFESGKIQDACRQGALGKRLHRIAAVVGDGQATIPVSIALPPDANAEYTFDLVLLCVEGLPERLVELTGIEVAMAESTIARPSAGAGGGSHV